MVVKLYNKQLLKYLAPWLPETSNEHARKRNAGMIYRQFLLCFLSSVKQKVYNNTMNDITQSAANP